MPHQQTVILYHGGCPDGFGAAYAAWKEYGDSAEYIPLKHGRPAPENLAGKHLIFVDFSYPKETMERFVREAASVTVLDHHLGAKAVVESMPEYVFDNDRSGATIAWSYFHPDRPVPTFLKYVEDGDLYLFKLPDSRAVLAYAYAQPFHFEIWDELVRKMDDETERAAIIERGKIYAEHFAILVEQIANKASLVSFEGFECYYAPMGGMFASDVGNLLVRMKPPLSITASFHADILNVSLRSDDSTDVSAIARKYGGNGHPRAAGFSIPWGAPLPWTVIETDGHENPRD